MGLVTLLVNQVAFIMTYNGENGHRGREVNPLSSYNIVVNRVNTVEKANINTVNMGEQPTQTVLGHYPVHCNVDGHFPDPYYITGPTPVAQVFPTFNNLFIPGMAVTVTSTDSNYVYELPVNSVWLISKYRTDRRMADGGGFKFSLELIRYTLDVEG